ncbi:B3/4 domain-containing protein [Agrococcus versicolor]|uniref:B3/4 domain-containing protein n=1 Tax=Agrococcus versicolor TaxID=501482 RepID=A0ABN3AID8_9MICO
MTSTADLQRILDGASVAAEVHALRPDYRALLLAVDGLEPGEGDARSEALLIEAEASAAAALAAGPVEEIPHVAAWREAYRAFGAKPQRTRSSAEALLRRAAASGLPRVDRLTDVYNAISVLHRTPLGGESLAAYVGPARLVRATGEERFDTSVDGADAIEHPEVGEVVWRDDQGVTCRRWNWRQGRRTRLHPTTRSALFIVDALAPVDDDGLEAIGDALLDALGATSPGLVAARRTIGAEA